MSIQISLAPVRNPKVTAPQNTMSSVELVGIINGLRDEGSSELRHDHFMVKIEKHPGIQSPEFLGDYKDARGRKQKCYHLPKREATLMVMSESLAVQTAVYDRMEALEGQATASTPKPTASEELEFWNLVVESLNLAPSAKLAGIRSIAMGHGMTNTLPNVPFYAIDAPAGAVAVVGAPTSAEPVASLSDLLKQNRIPMSSVAFNKLLVAQGYVQELTRPSTANASVLRKYKAVTEKGLAYGKNVVEPSNPKETQPMWYISKFAALAELVLG